MQPRPQLTASLFVLLISLGSVTPAVAGTSDETKREASQNSTTAIEQRISALLQQGRCKDAISELHAEYALNQASRLLLFYGRAFRQCNDVNGMNEAYRGVFRDEKMFSAAELEEARRVVPPAVWVRNLETAVLPPKKPETPSLAQDKPMANLPRETISPLVRQALPAHLCPDSVDYPVVPSATETEKAILDLLNARNCGAALVELHRASRKGNQPRLSLYYARAYCQCGSREGMESAYRTVLEKKPPPQGALGKEPEYSTAEFEEARRGTEVITMLNHAPQVQVSHYTYPRLRTTGQVLTGIGGTLFGIGAVVLLSGLVPRAPSNSHCCNLVLIGGVLMGTSGFFLLPGIPMLAVASSNPK